MCNKGFAEIFNDLDADFFCLQETKLSAGQLDLQFDGYTSHWHYAEKKGYSGTAIYDRRKAKHVKNGVGSEPHDAEGRAVTLDCGDFYLVTIYSPNAQNELARLGFRLEWEKALRDYLVTLDAEKPVIVCGDLNVAHQEIDLKNPKTNHGNPGFSDEERGAFGELLDAGFTDTFRHVHPDRKDAYTWWSYRYNARAKNIGWRIDYFLVSNRLADSISKAKILDQITGSDHCPILLEIKIQ